MDYPQSVVSSGEHVAGGLVTLDTYSFHKSIGCLEWDQLEGDQLEGGCLCRRRMPFPTFGAFVEFLGYDDRNRQQLVP